MSKIDGNLQTRLQTVHQRIANACAAVGGPAQAVALLAVSKTQDAQAVRVAAQAGQRAFGENYLQEAVEKMAAVQDLALQWHMIGPVQANKTRLVAQQFDWVHAVDRLRIGQRLSDQRPATLAPLNICIQVNVDGGAAKSGVAPDAVLELARALAPLPRLCLRGLMCIPEPLADPDAQYAVFMRARRVFEQVLQAEPGLAAWDTLSMGMSEDLEAAIRAGSTVVRVGTAIFGARGAGAVF